MLTFFRLKYEQGYVPVAHLKKVPKTGLLKVAQPSPKTRRKHFFTDTIS